MHFARAPDHDYAALAMRFRTRAFGRGLLDGMACMLDFGATLPPPVQPERRATNDSQRLAADGQRVLGDFSRAYEAEVRRLGR